VTDKRPPMETDPKPVVPPLWRQADPQTSREAVKESLAGLGSQQRAVLAAIRRNPGLTASELAERCELNRVQIGKRAPDLARAGLVQKGEPKRSPVSGRREVTWYPAAEIGGVA